MKILVSGGTGFIASKIACSYAREGHQVLAIDVISPEQCATALGDADFSRIDICDGEAVRKIIYSYRPNIVSHHAAQIDVRRSVQNPAEDARINLLGGLHLLQHAMAAGVKRFIFASSGGAIYGQQNHLPAAETAECKPLSPYGLAKLTFERYISLVCTTDQMLPVVLRYANVYGPGQSSNGEAGVISVFTHNILTNKSCTIYGDGTSTRDYIYIDDVVEANDRALHIAERGSFNIGTGTETSIRQVYETIANSLGVKRSDTPPICQPARPGEIKRIKLCNRSARQKLGWVPKVLFVEGVQRTVEWHAARYQVSVAS